MKKHNYFYWIVCSGLIFITSCKFQVLSPRPSDPAAVTQGVLVNAEGQIEINVEFTDPVDTNTVIAGKTLFLKFTNNANESAKLRWDSLSKNKLTIITTDKKEELMLFNHDDGFTLTLVGSDAGNGVIRSTRGKTLDGDYNSRAGGDFKMQFTLPENSVTFVQNR